VLDVMHKQVLSKEDLISCLVNMEEVAGFLKLAKLMFKGENGRVLAATYIAKRWKGFK
jgi:hypothetical protein